MVKDGVDRAPSLTRTCREREDRDFGAPPLEETPHLPVDVPLEVVQGWKRDRGLQPLVLRERSGRTLPEHLRELALDAEFLGPLSALPPVLGHDPGALAVLDHAPMQPVCRYRAQL